MVLLKIIKNKKKPKNDFLKIRKNKNKIFFDIFLKINKEIILKYQGNYNINLKKILMKMLENQHFLLKCNKIVIYFKQNRKTVKFEILQVTN